MDRPDHGLELGDSADADTTARSKLNSVVLGSALRPAAGAIAHNSADADYAETDDGISVMTHAIKKARLNPPPKMPG